MHLRPLQPPLCIPRYANFRYAHAAAFCLQHACLAVPEIQPVAQRIPGSTHRQSPHGAKAPRTLHIPSNPCASSSLRSLSKRTSPPASLNFFNGRMGSPKLLWNAVRLPLRSAGSVGQGDSLHLSLLQCGVVPWEKSITLSPRPHVSEHSPALAPHIPRSPIALPLRFRIGKVSRL